MNGTISSTPTRLLRVFIVAGEASGDQLGAQLMRALRAEYPGPISFQGVGGAAMSGLGLEPNFPLSDISVMGFLPVIRRLPLLLQRIRETADAIVMSSPDCLVLIDSPDFTHRVARRARAQLRNLPVIDYVSPSVWAWRTGRAKAMRSYIDHVLALLPFEPAAYLRLSGPDCTYVGHPLIERFEVLRPSPQEAAAREENPPTVVILPGSRHAEVERLLHIFGETAVLINAEVPGTQFVVPAVPHLESEIRSRVAKWPVLTSVVSGEAAKLAAFRRARAALAASGTVALELALSGIPSVIAYRVPKIEEVIVRTMTKVRSFILTNLILGEDLVPGYLQRDCNPQKLGAAMVALLRNGQERDAQLAALARVEQMVRLPPGETPSGRAAKIVLKYIV